MEENGVVFILNQRVRLLIKPSGDSRLYQWEQEVVEPSVSVPAFGLRNAVVIFGRQPAGEGGIGSSEAGVFTKGANKKRPCLETLGSAYICCGV